MRITPTKFLGTFILLGYLFTCAPSQEEPAVDFLHPVVTRLTFYNTTGAAQPVGVWPAYYLDDFGGGLPDSLAAGDSLSVTLSLHAPQRLIVQTGPHRRGYELLPGKDRRVAVSNAETTNRGPHRATYDVLDRGEDWVPTSLGPEWVVLPYDKLLDSLRVLGAAALDSLNAAREASRAEDWDLLEAELRMKTLRHQVSYAAYRRFFYKEVHVTPEWLADSAYHLLELHPYGTVAGHKDLWQALIVAETNAAMDSTAEKLSAGTRNYTAFMEHYLAQPDGPAGYAARAELVMDMIGANRNFTDRQLIQDSLLASLPPAYRRRVHDYADAFARTQGNAGLAALFAAALPEETADSLVLRDARESGLTLYKFWFAGCYPCLLQYPAEDTLLGRYPDLRIHTVAFATESATWRDYLADRRPPGSRHFFVSERDRPLLKDAVGDIGAPYYVLLRGDSVVCRSCPKPSDPLLQEYLGPAPAES